MMAEENILENMLDRVTNPGTEVIDELAMRIFCMEVRHDSKLIQKALNMIMKKIRSENESEAVKAIMLLEESMAKCGTDFQNEVSRFRFLNDLIRMVSNKYNGPETSPLIKKRIMQCLLLWTTDYPERTKIREAYDSLNKEIEAFDEINIAVATRMKRENILGIDGQLLTKLLQSGDPDNLKRANMLIQHRVNEDARHTELIRQHKSELTTVQNTVSLLNQMLDTYESDESGLNDETKHIIRDLYLECKKHRLILKRLPELLENLDNDLVVSTLETNESLHEALQRYKLIVNKLFNVSTINNSSTSNTDLLASLLTDINPTIGPAVTTAATTPTTSTKGNKVPMSSNSSDLFDELPEQFVRNDFSENLNKADKLLCDVNTLSDVALLPAQAALMTATTEKTMTPQNAEIAKNYTKNIVGDQQKEKRPFRELPEIDEISTTLLKTNLKNYERIGSFKKDIAEKLTLNDLAKEKLNPKAAASFPLIMSEQTVEIKKANTNKTSSSSIDAKRELEDNDELILLCNTEEEVMSTASLDSFQNTKINLTGKEEEFESTENMRMVQNNLPPKHLSDIDVCLDNVLPTGDSMVLLDDDDMRITLNFTENRPAVHVSVLVITVENKSKFPIKTFQFEASVKKPCKVRLLSPTDTSILPWRPFRPPMPINQAMLVLNSTGRSVDVTCIVSYKLGDDPDPVNESIIAKNIPYVS